MFHFLGYFISFNFLGIVASISSLRLLQKPSKFPLGFLLSYWSIFIVFYLIEVFLQYLISSKYFYSILSHSPSYKHTQNPSKTHQGKSRYNPLNSNNRPFRNFVVWLGGLPFEKEAKQTELTINKCSSFLFCH